MSGFPVRIGHNVTKVCYTPSMINTAKTPTTTKVLQQIYLRISLGSWVGYTLRTIPKGRALLDSSGNQTQECIYAPSKKLAQVYLRMQIRDRIQTLNERANETNTYSTYDT